jgi:hypothetical protein
MDRWILPIVSVVVATVSSFLVAMYWYGRKVRQSAAEKLAANAVLMGDRVRDLERELEGIKANVKPFSVALQDVLIRRLTNFHTPVLDALLEKVGIEMSVDDEERLREALSIRIDELNGHLDELERDAAIMLPMVMRWVRKERGNTDGDLQVVIVPPAHE